MSTLKTKYICEHCGEVKETKTEKRIESFPVKGEPINILSTIRICQICGDPIYDRFLDSLNLEAAFEKYREKYYIISPARIKKLRDDYGLSQRALGGLLGWGEITIHRYENGSLPDDAHNQVLKFIQDPLNMRRIAEENSNKLKPRAFKRLLSRVSALIQSNQKGTSGEQLLQVYRLFLIKTEGAPTVFTQDLSFLTEKPSLSSNATNASHISGSFNLLSDLELKGKAISL